jgi:hypothetical protein
MSHALTSYTPRLTRTLPAELAHPRSFHPSAVTVSCSSGILGASHGMIWPTSELQKAQALALHGTECHQPASSRSPRMTAPGGYVYSARKLRRTAPELASTYAGPPSHQRRPSLVVASPGLAVSCRLYRAACAVPVPASNKNNNNR